MSEPELELGVELEHVCYHRVPRRPYTKHTDTDRTVCGCRVIEQSYRSGSHAAVQRDDKGNFRTLARRADDGQTLSVHLGQPAMCIG